MNHSNRFFYYLILGGLLLSLAVFAGQKPPDACKKRGLASYYSNRFKGRRTSSGEKYHPDSFTCAHHTLPFGTRLIVTSLKNGKTIQVKVNDRLSVRSRRMIDLSRAGAAQLQMLREGIIQVEIRCADSLR